MRAITYTRPGGPDVLELIDRPVPEPGPGEVRVRIAFSGAGVRFAGSRLVASFADPRGAGHAPGSLALVRLSTENVMLPILDAVRAYATIGEMCDALREVWGEYEEVAMI